VSYFLLHGPNKKYVYSGYYLIDAKAGLNSITLVNKGKRSLVFKDGQKIEFDFPNVLDGVYNCLRNSTLGHLLARFDRRRWARFASGTRGMTSHWTSSWPRTKRSNLEGSILLLRPSDYFEGNLIVKGEKVSFMHGSYLSHINFDNVRYWDYREVTPYRV
jgi:hypothetical protein